MHKRGLHCAFGVTHAVQTSTGSNTSGLCLDDFCGYFSFHHLTAMMYIVPHWFVEIWNEIDQEEIRHLISSMRRRSEAVIINKDGTTQYC